MVKKKKIAKKTTKPLKKSNRKPAKKIAKKVPAKKQQPKKKAAAEKKVVVKKEEPRKEPVAKQPEPTPQPQEDLKKIPQEPEIQTATNIAQTLKLREITTEMEESYLDYAMSVIVARALPDVRDGLKPVHRRILYTMSKLGLTHGAKFVKSARIVGDCLGKYHPHGDSAVYETMVRLAQPFSLRYPLVHGQGNFGCFTGDTKIALTDGRKVNFKQLIKEWKAEKKNYTYTFNPTTQNIEIAEIQHPRRTRKKATLVRVTLDNGQKIRCTPDHKFLLRNGTYIEAEKLQKGVSIMPLYTRQSTHEDDQNIIGYTMVYQPQGRWEWTHHLADAWNLSHNVYQKSQGRIRHHRDFNKRNNNPDNIERLHWEEHWRKHYEVAAERHANDPVYREKLAEGRKRYWNNAEIRAQYAERLRSKNQKNWQKARYRNAMAEKAKQRWEQGIYDKEKLRAFAKKNIRRLWNDPDYRRMMSTVKSEELKKRWQNTKYRAGFSKLMKKLSPKIWSSKKHRAHISNLLKQRWQDPEYRAYMLATLLKDNGRKTHYNHFLNICEKAIQQYGFLNDYSYDETRRTYARPGQGIIRLDTALDAYFKNDFGALQGAVKEKILNHKIVSVERCKKREDVYDLTINGTHNFALAAGVFVHNSIDGDSAAAMRYTEAKMEKISEEMLADIEKETVRFQPNYDGTNDEPSVLPSKLPQLLLNGTMGIAVGMATNIPPHNLSETVDAIMHLADHPKATVEELMEFIKGPDFPTGGTIYDWKAIQDMYINGRGGITIRAKANIEEGKGNRFRIIVSEVPYQVNKATLIEKMASLVQDKKIQGISDIRDESSRNEIRVVIELKKDAYPKKVLNALYKYTELQTNFNMNMIALVDGIQPRLLNLKLVLEYFMKHRIEVITNRCQYDLKVARDREHILEGLNRALNNIDAIIKTIKQSADRDEAHKALMKKFGMSDRQSNAILDMRLQTLAGLERKKIEDELKEKKKLIAYLEDVLKSPKKILGIMKDELTELKKQYGDERRTRVTKGKIGEFSDKDTIPNEPMVLTLSRENYIKRITPNAFRAQHRGGKGIIGTTTKEEDEVRLILHANNHDEVLFFTNKGRIFQMPVYEAPLGSRVSKGQSIVNLLNLQENEIVTSMLSMEGAKLSKKFLFMATCDGTVKKTSTEEFENIRRSGLIAIKLRPGDSLDWIRETSGEDQIVIITENGKCIRFNEKDVRPLGRASQGVRGIMLQKDDRVVVMDAVPKGTRANLLVVTENGLGKYTSLSEYRQQHRGGTGVKTASITAKTGKIIGARVLEEGYEGDLLLISKKGQTIRISVKDIPGRGRATQGVYLMRLKPGDKVASISVFHKEEIEKGTIVEAKEPVAESKEKAQAGRRK